MRLEASLITAPLLLGWMLALSGSASADAAAIPRLSLPAGTGPHGPET